MKKRSNSRLLVTFASAAVIITAYHFLVRPWMLDWRAPRELREMTLSGDNLVMGVHHSRAVLANAAPGEIWPWLVQLGQERGGFYSYEWLENLVGARMNNVFVLKTELQTPRERGDTVWLSSKETYRGQGYQILAEVTPQQSLVMVSGEDYARLLQGHKAQGSWAIYLIPEDATHTWIVARSTGGSVTAFGQLMSYLFFETPHFIMEQKMLRTLKQLSEQNSGQRNQKI